MFLLMNGMCAVTMTTATPGAPHDSNKLIVTLSAEYALLFALSVRTMRKCDISDWPRDGDLDKRRDFVISNNDDVAVFDTKLPN